MIEKPLEDWEDPDEPSDPEDDEADTLVCPACGSEVYEDAEQCPYCREYLTSPSTSVLADRPWWFVLLALLGMVAVIIALLSF